jgi:uncharacterized protein YggE
MRAAVILAMAFAGLLTAQTTPTVQAQGTATLAANPDQAQITVSVITNGPTAQAAAQANATTSTAVQNALKALNPAPVIQTVGYSVYPQYTGGQILSGYTASNSIQVTTLDLSTIGNLIDTANQAGANSVSGITFGLQNPDPVKQQALTAAAKQARAHADAIAAGLGGKSGPVVSAVEASSYTPIYAGGVAAGTAVPTPVQTGQVSVTANVTITFQLTQ